MTRDDARALWRLVAADQRCAELTAACTEVLPDTPKWDEWCDLMDKASAEQAAALAAITGRG